MKWKRGPTEFLPEKTFLIIKDDLYALEEKNRPRGKPKTVAATNTWPPKMKRVQPLFEDERPKTANLEKPSVLNPNLVDKLDMSLLSKELLCDSMTRYQSVKTISGGTSFFPSKRRQSVAVGEQNHSQVFAGGCWGFLGSPALRQYKRRSFEQILDTRFYQVDPLSNCSPNMQKKGPSVPIQEHPKKQSLEIKKLDDNNNRNGSNGSSKTLSTLKKKNSRISVSPTDVEVFTSLSTRSAPEPCKTCGRPDQPERFHSHPKGCQTKPKKLPKTKTAIPKSIQKPVPLNFRSDKNRNKIDEDTVQNTNLNILGEPTQNRPPRPLSAPIKKGPKTITCYICGREFGTASFPIHEPRCMEKWERENSSLPASQRRPPPQKPSAPFGHHDWNATAWEESQMQLLPCSRCGRTFLPERLPIHQRCCIASPKNTEGLEKSDSPTVLEKKSASSTRVGPPTIGCKICGRKFGTRSIKIHEPQCIKRWNIENGSLPLGQTKKSASSDERNNSPAVSPLGDAPQKRTITCYICGRDFGSSSIVIHEPQCLKKWHVENDKLPPSQRRNPPEKPETIYTQESRSGNFVIDTAAMAEASWKSHLKQLIPCKRCGRTFNPDRVAVHERSCKGTR